MLGGADGNRGAGLFVGANSFAMPLPVKSVRMNSNLQVVAAAAGLKITVFPETIERGNANEFAPAIMTMISA